MRLLIYYNSLMACSVIACGTTNTGNTHSANKEHNMAIFGTQNLRYFNKDKNDQLTRTLEKLYENDDAIDTSNGKITNQWQLFKKINNKSYENDDERIKIFVDNTKNIWNHNKKYYSNKVGYKMGVNRFTDLTGEEFMKLIGCTRLVTHEKNSAYYINRMPVYRFQDVIYKSKQVNFQSMAKNKNWKIKTLNVVRPSRDQGDCAACYAFAAVSTLEGHLRIFKNQHVTLSPQQLVDCQKTYTDSGCKGGRVLNSFAYINAYGILPENLYPYVGADQKCEFDKNQTVGRVVGVVSVTKNETELKLALNYGPVASSLNARVLQFYRSGIVYEENCPNDINHAVTVVGYGSDRNGNEFWEIQNSWGAHWGDNGFMKIARNKNNHCGIGLEAAYPILK